MRTTGAHNLRKWRRKELDPQVLIEAADMLIAQAKHIEDCNYSQTIGELRNMNKALALAKNLRTLFKREVTASK
jgi:hypothetical protein